MNWRRNANSLSPLEKKLFIDAVKALKTPYPPQPPDPPKPPKPTNRYNEYVAWHQKAGDKETSPSYGFIAHSSPAFLP